MTYGLYRRVLGADYDRLPTAVRQLHDIAGESVWAGRADVMRGTSMLARVMATVAGMPPAGRDQPLKVTFTARDGVEVWHRTFGAKIFTTRQFAGNGGVRERVGLATITLLPNASAEGLALSLGALHVLGIPAPRFLRPVITTREHEKGGRYHFEVELQAPWIGRIVRYEGWLEPALERITSSTRP